MATTTARRKTTTAKKVAPEREMILFKRDKSGIAITVPEGCSCSIDRDYDEYSGDSQDVFIVEDETGSIMGKFYDVTHYYDNRLNVRSIDPSLYMLAKSSGSEEEEDEDYDRY